MSSRKLLSLPAAGILAASFLAGVGSAGTGPEYTPPATKEIVAKMLEAHGGIERWRACPTVAFDSHLELDVGGGNWIEFWEEVTVDARTRRVYADLPNKDGTKGQIAFDGETAWSAGNLQGLSRAPARFTAWRNFYLFDIPWMTQDDGVILGEPGEEVQVEVPIINIGDIGGSGDDPYNPVNLNRNERYILEVIFGDRRTGTRQPVLNAETGESVFTKPVDNIGTKSIPDYNDYARNFVYEIESLGIPTGRIFVGQRKDPFVVNLGETFDLVNLNPIGPEDGEQDDLADKNVTSFIVEVPIEFLLGDGGDPVIGGWTTASKRRHSGPGDPAAVQVDFNSPVTDGNHAQVSRLGMPLVNEILIGCSDKDGFNESEPKNDGQLFQYVTHPTLPALLENLFGVQAPTLFPRNDLVAVFLTGLEGLNQPDSVIDAWMLRLNTDTPPTPRCDQNRLGVLGGDLAGFPNGRRPGDDVVDTSFRVAMGFLLPPDVAPDGNLPYTDGAYVDARYFPNAFPYLNTPLPGSPDDFEPEPQEQCPPGGEGVTRLVLRNQGPDIIVFLFTSSNQVINGGVPATLPPGGEFTAQFDTVLEDVNLSLDDVDQGLSIDVPLNRKLLMEYDGEALSYCETSLDGECS